MQYSHTFCHYSHRPGSDEVKELGGLHDFMKWNRNLLTDSGGFQMVSLLHLAEITEEGVQFRNPIDGTPMMLTPEESIRCQNNIGADIIMALDDVVSSVNMNQERFVEATARTLRWIDRCIAAHSRPDEQNLFGILQGGLDVTEGGLREQCLKGMLERDKSLPGYAIGGLAGGEDKENFWRVVAQATKYLQEHVPHKPRYLMGVGYPLDLVVCSALGVDMYDCVFPTRTARFGTALIPQGQLKLKSNSCKDDMNPIDETCPCMVCRKYSRAYLHMLCKTEPLGAQLLTYHNIAYMMRLMRTMRMSIINDRFPHFVRGFLADQFPSGDIPQWVKDALEEADISLDISEGMDRMSQQEREVVSKLYEL
jgi:tRNA-guanine transglycosylase